MTTNHRRRTANALQITGVCTMSIITSLSVVDQANPPTNLRVSGNIERAPIKPDPADPNFTGLLVEAWLAGLQRSIQASTVVDLAFNRPQHPLLFRVRNCERRASSSK
jgi:hypothetical protein